MIDELFSDVEVLVHPTARIVCVVCTRPAEVPIDADGRICDLCRPQAAAHIEARHTAAVEALVDAWQAWDATLEAATEDVRARWARVEAARGAPRFAEAWKAAKAAGGPFGALLVAREQLQAVADASNEVFVWAARARAEVER